MFYVLCDINDVFLISAADKARFFSAFYKELDKAIQSNISEVHR